MLKKYDFKLQNLNSMDNESNFFSDPKVIISILAIIISIFTLIWTLGNQAEQNRRWNKLNEEM